MKYQDNRIEKVRKVFKRLIYDWTFESATFYQFMDFSKEVDNWDEYWFKGAKGLKDYYDWLWGGKGSDWDGFAEYFTNKIFDVIPEIVIDIMNDNGIEKDEDEMYEIEIDFTGYGLSSRLYNEDDIDYDVVRYVYETDTDMFNEMISKMLDNLGYYNTCFTIKF